MNTTGFARLCAGTTLALCALALLTWTAFVRPLALLHLPQGFHLAPLSAALMGMVALAMLASIRRSSRGLVHGCLGLVAILCVVILAEHVLLLGAGIEDLLLDHAVDSVLAAEFPGRPSALVCVSLLLMCGATWISLHGRQGRFDPADVCAVAALFPAMSYLLGYLFQADILMMLYRGRFEGGIYLPEALLICVLAFGILAGNPQGLLATWGSESAGGAAKRRLMPAAVLTPVVLGVIQAVALHARLLDPAMAVALTAVGGIFVSIVLIEWVSGLLSERAEEQAGELMERETKAREEGMTDALTGLLNRRGWDHHLRQAEENYKTRGGNACVVVIDLDGLKRINDTEGHTAGDALIRRAAQALQTGGRREDLQARLGGDEFCYLAFDCQPAHAEVVITRLTQAFDKLKVQASLGYAMRDLAGSLQNAFHEADEAMYAHKRRRKAARLTG